MVVFVVVVFVFKAKVVDNVASVFADGVTKLTMEAFDEIPVVKTSGDGPVAAFMLGCAAVLAVGKTIMAV